MILATRRRLRDDGVLMREEPKEIVVASARATRGDVFARHPTALVKLPREEIERLERAEPLVAVVLARRAKRSRVVAFPLTLRLRVETPKGGAMSRQHRAGKVSERL